MNELMFAIFLLVWAIIPDTAHATSYTLTIWAVASEKSYMGTCTPKYKSCDVTVIMPLAEHTGLLSFNTIEFRATISKSDTMISFFWGDIPLSPAPSGMSRFSKSTDDLIAQPLLTRLYLLHPSAKNDDPSVIVLRPPNKKLIEVLIHVTPDQTPKPIDTPSKNHT